MITEKLVVSDHKTGWKIPTRRIMMTGEVENLDGTEHQRTASSITQRVCYWLSGERDFSRQHGDDSIKE